MVISPPRRPQQLARGSSLLPAHKPPAPAGSALPTAPAPEHCDGRAMRLLQSVKDSHRVTQLAFQGVKGFLASPPEDAVGTLGKPDALSHPHAALKACLAESWKQLKSCSARLAQDSVRLGRSPGKDQPLGQQLVAELPTASGEVASLLELFNVVCGNHKLSGHAYVEALEPCSRAGLRLPAAFHYHQLSASVGALAECRQDRQGTGSCAFRLCRGERAAVRRSGCGRNLRSCVKHNPQLCHGSLELGIHPREHLFPAGGTRCNRIAGSDPRSGI